MKYERRRTHGFSFVKAATVPEQRSAAPEGAETALERGMQLGRGGVELVADAAYGEDELGVLGVALDLLAEVGDVDVTGSLVAVELGLPQLLHDLGAGEDLAGAADEEAQELELRAGQV